jgi:hypothetical protein
MAFQLCLYACAMQFQACSVCAIRCSLSGQDTSEPAGGLSACCMTAVVSARQAVHQCRLEPGWFRGRTSNPLGLGSPVVRFHLAGVLATAALQLMDTRTCWSSSPRTVCSRHPRADWPMASRVNSLYLGLPIQTPHRLLQALFKRRTRALQKPLTHGQAGETKKYPPAAVHRTGICDLDKMVCAAIQCKRATACTMKGFKPSERKKDMLCGNEGACWKVVNEAKQALGAQHSAMRRSCTTLQKRS